MSRAIVVRNNLGRESLVIHRSIVPGVGELDLKEECLCCPRDTWLGRGKRQKESMGHNKRMTKRRESPVENKTNPMGESGKALPI